MPTPADFRTFNDYRNADATYREHHRAVEKWTAIRSALPAGTIPARVGTVEANRTRAMEARSAREDELREAWITARASTQSDA